MNWGISMNKAKIASTLIVDKGAIIGKGTRVWNFVPLIVVASVDIVLLLPQFALVIHPGLRASEDQHGHHQYHKQEKPGHREKE